MISVSRRIMISAPRDSVRMYLRDLKNIPEYEQKVDDAQVSYPEPDMAEMQVSGKFRWVPWSGVLKVKFTKDGGYRSEIIRGSLRRMNADFQLRPVSGGTVVTHREQYQFPLLLRPFSFLIRGWLENTMDKELAVIKEKAESLNRRIQLQQIEKL